MAEDRMPGHSDGRSGGVLVVDRELGAARVEDLSSDPFWMPLPCVGDEDLCAPVPLPSGKDDRLGAPGADSNPGPDAESAHHDLP